MNERLHKLLAQHGIGSRRQVESWIREGRVLVNGRPAEIGQHLVPGDRVVVDGRDFTKLLTSEQRLRVIAYHKPCGEMLRRQDGDEREGVETRLPTLRAGRWVAINALGYGEDGLLLLTSDGPFASAIARRGHEIPVEYRVRALRPRQDADWPAIPLSVDVEGTTAQFTSVEPAGSSGTNMWFRLVAERTLPRGAIRALFDSAGLKLNRTMLVKWGPVALPRDLPRGRSRELAGPDLDALLALGGRAQPSPVRKPRAQSRGKPSRARGPRTPAGDRPTGRRNAGR